LSYSVSTISIIGIYFSNLFNCINFLKYPLKSLKVYLLSLSFASQDVATTNRIYLESSYIREENGKSYVMKDSNGKLVKQYVTTGQIVSGGYAIEIKAGLTEEDYIAFPYGKTAQEGVKTNKRA